MSLCIPGHNFKRLTCNFALIAIACSLCADCTSSSPPSQRIIVAIDRSESTDYFRGQQLDAVDYAAASSVLHNSQLDVWCYDTTATEVYTPQVPDRVEVVNVVKREQMIPDPNHQRCRTRPADLLEHLISSLDDPAAPKTVKILLLTDGDNDFFDDPPRIKKDLKAIACQCNAQIAIAGVTPNNVSQWNAWLRPTFGSKYTVTELPQAADSIHRFLK